MIGSYRGRVEGYVPSLSASRHLYNVSNADNVKIISIFLSGEIQFLLN